MITHRQKQFAIIAFAIVFLLIVTYNIHQDVRIRHPSENAMHLDHSHNAMEKFVPDTTTPAFSTSTEFLEHVKGKLQALIQAGALEGPPGKAVENDEAASTSGEVPTEAVTTVPGTNYVFDLINLNTKSSMDSSATEASTAELTTTSSSEEPAPTTTSESSSTTSASYAVISHLSYETVTPKPVDYKYSRALVIARTSKEDISWIDEVFGDDALLQKAIYTVDKPVEPYILPANKGHEVMAYLTFIIDFYDTLPEVNIFLHAHDLAWHNNELLDMSSKEMLKHLNLRKVIRDGYVNLRCHRWPSCPDHLFPLARNQSDWQVPEEGVFADAWQDLLPFEQVPEVVSQPCCGQFAVSAERIRLLPKAQYQHFRRWLMYTTLEDRLSGRVWEYIYQYIWLGEPQFCPKEHVCYCDLYGICFGGETQYEDYYGKKTQIDILNGMVGNQIEQGGNETWPVDYKTLLGQAKQGLDDERRSAFLRGSDPYNRAAEVGRPFQAGDGF